MSLRRSLVLGGVALLLTAAGYWHIEVTDSRPKADEVLTEAPSEIWIRFSVPPDLEQTGIALLGTNGMVTLDEVTSVDSLSISAGVAGEIGPGEYIVSWRSAPHNDHGSRGRFKFTVESR